jgi:hypothetical protein
MARRTIKNIREAIDGLSASVQRHNFVIDVAYLLYRIYKDKLKPARPDVNIKVLSAYWALEILAIWETKKWPLEAKTVFLEVEYYSYLNLIELEGNAAAGGYSVQITDFIFNTTDLKEGDDMHGWMLSNDSFQEDLAAHWEDVIMDIWIAKGWLHHKKGANLANYWKAEDFILMLKIMNPDLEPVSIQLLGTTSDYI